MVHAAGTEIEHSRVVVNRAAGRIEYDWCDSAKRILSEVSGAPVLEALTEVPAWGGHGSVATSATWNLVRNWLEGQAELLRELNSDVELINATEGGSHIAGFAERTLAEVLRELPELGISAGQMRKRAALVGPPIDAGAVQQWIADQADRTAHAGQTARDLVDAVEGALEALSISEPRSVNLAYERLDSAERDLRQAIARQPLLDAWCHESIDDIVTLATTSGPVPEAAASARAALEAETRIAEALCSGAEELERVMRSTSTKK